MQDCILQFQKTRIILTFKMPYAALYAAHRAEVRSASSHVMYCFCMVLHRNLYLAISIFLLLVFSVIIEKGFK